MVANWIERNGIDDKKEKDCLYRVNLVNKQYIGGEWLALFVVVVSVQFDVFAFDKLASVVVSYWPPNMRQFVMWHTFYDKNTEKKRKENRNFVFISIRSSIALLTLEIHIRSMDFGC